VAQGDFIDEHMNRNTKAITKEDRLVRVKCSLALCCVKTVKLHTLVILKARPKHIFTYKKVLFLSERPQSCVEEVWQKA